MVICATLLESPNPEKSQGTESWERGLAGSGWEQGLVALGMLQLFLPRMLQSNLIIISIGTLFSPLHSKSLLRSVLPAHPHVISVMQRWTGNGSWLVQGPETLVAMGLEGNHELLRPVCQSSISPSVLLPLNLSVSLLEMRWKRFKRIFLIIQEVKLKPSASLGVGMSKSWVILWLWWCTRRKKHFCTSEAISGLDSPWGCWQGASWSLGISLSSTMNCKQALFLFYSSQLIIHFWEAPYLLSKIIRAHGISRVSVDIWVITLCQAPREALYVNFLI